MALLKKTRIIIGEIEKTPKELKSFLESADVNLSLSKAVSIEELQKANGVVEKKLEQYRRLISIKSNLTALINEMKKGNFDEVMIR